MPAFSPVDSPLNRDCEGVLGMLENGIDLTVLATSFVAGTQSMRLDTPGLL